MAQNRDNFAGPGEPLLEGPSAEDFGEVGPTRHQGQNKSPRQIESQAGRKEGRAKRAAGAKSQATRAAKGGALKKAKGRTGSQKAGKQQTGRRKAA
jgi:hypothetical protein